MLLSCCAVAGDQGPILHTLLKTSEIKQDIQDNIIVLIMIR